MIPGGVEQGRAAEELSEDTCDDEDEEYNCDGKDSTGHGEDDTEEKEGGPDGADESELELEDEQEQEQERKYEHEHEHEHEHKHEHEYEHESDLELDDEQEDSELSPRVALKPDGKSSTADEWKEDAHRANRPPSYLDRAFSS